MKLTLMTLAVLGAMTSNGMADDLVTAARACAADADSDRRLLCYDGVFRTQVESPPIEGKGKWVVQTDTSKLTDSRNAVAYLSSEDTFPARFGGSEKHAEMWIRCFENATSFQIGFADHFLADNGSYGKVTYRIDDKKAQSKGMAESTDHSVLGLWNGGSSIPLIKSMIGGKRMIVRLTPFNESSLEATFDIAGVAEAIKPVRETCKW
jgi:type VI secretion system protein VasI